MAKLANEAMNLQRWACNRREAHALFTAARTAAEWLEIFPALIFTAGGRGARGTVRRPEHVECGGVPLGSAEAIAGDLANLGIVVDVRHIEGKKDSRADELSRIAEEVVVRTGKGKNQVIHWKMVGAMASREVAGVGRSNCIMVIGFLWWTSVLGGIARVVLPDHLLQEYARAVHMQLGLYWRSCGRGCFVWTLGIWRRRRRRSTCSGRTSS